MLKKAYDTFDRVLSLTYPDGSWVAYEYDPLYLRKVKRYNPGGQYLYSHTYEDYDMRGQLQREELMGALGSVKHRQDEKGRPTGLQSVYFSQVVEEYDLEGNLLLVREGDEFRRLRYDSLSQLASEESSQDAYTYTYDSGYNCVTKNGQEALHNNLNQIFQMGELECQYDKQGRLVEKRFPEEVSSFIYDALDRLVQASRGGVEVSFTYDPLGKRLSKHVHDDNAWIWKDWEEVYFYDGDIELGAQDRSNQITHARVLGWSPQRDIGSAIGVEIGSKAYAPIHDLQGNVRALVDPKSGMPGATYRYTSFGEELSSESAIENPWKYASKRWDKETGVILFGKRYYDPVVGKWLTQDPAGFTQSMNLYHYCLNNPWHWVDPDGQFFFVLAIPIIYAGSWASAALIADIAIGAAVLAGTGLACHEMDKAFNGRPTAHDYGGQAAFVGGNLFYQNSRSGLFGNDLSSWFRDNPNAAPAEDHEGAIEKDWKDARHPKAKKTGHHDLVDPESGDEWRYDEPKPGEPGHRGRGHWHHRNPQGTRGGPDEFLDASGNPCPKNSPQSHIYYE